MIHSISTDRLTIDIIQDIIVQKKTLQLSDEVIANVKRCRTYLDEKMEKESTPIYGINTGFGSLCNVKISNDNLTKLQENLVMSHACGTGERVPNDIVKLMLLLKIQSLGYGHSGVQLETIERLVEMYNKNILPVVYTQGSLGASGDLAPLAHVALVLIGEGSVVFNDREITTQELYKELGWSKILLQSKEGLALLNGTQFMSAYGVSNLIKAYKLSYFADAIGTVSLEGFDGNKSPFLAHSHIIRPHNGQLHTAERISSFLEGSELIEQNTKAVQDPYSFRCMPQVHGASKDTLNFVRKTFETEINSVTDNPNIFIEEDMIISAGNFHGQPLALGLDFLAIAVAELGSISERRTYQLISGLRNLPAFLVNDPGLNSGFMIPQYTAASIASINKQLCSPSSVDSIVSSNGQEDHVSMGANGAVKCKTVIDNVERILAIELLNATQAIEFRRPLKSSDFIESFITSYRKEVPFVEEDRLLHNDIQNSVLFLQNMILDNEVMFN
ncbi:histidine ammonia-lyase [Pseudofulvibacter geojedonensis]|uniref:Histidine ammonia-lyase n=1 Tax=Pseudofulvibacter geojedonensis TaxID=1123758 RepID=A0ABW3HYP8_9FLAO